MGKMTEKQWKMVVIEVAVLATVVLVASSWFGV